MANSNKDAKIAANFEAIKARSNGASNDGEFSSAGGPHHPRHGAVEEKRTGGAVPSKKEHLSHVSNQLAAKAAAGISPSHRDRVILHKHHVANGHTASQAKGHADRLASVAASARDEASSAAGQAAASLPEIIPHGAGE